MATTGFAVAADSNDLELSYAAETTWGTAPTGNYQKFRVNSEGFGETKNRTRPGEIRSDGQAAAQVTQDVSAQGNLSFGVSYGNVDDLWAGALNGAWTTPLAISDTGLSAVNATSKFVGAASDFANVEVGQWIKVSGFAVSGANGYFRVTAKAGDASDITVDPAPAEDANAGLNTISIVGSMLRNATTVTTFTVQKRWSASLGFAYPGVYFTGGQLDAARGEFFSGSLDAIAKSEDKQVAALGSGFDAAPTAKVMNTVSNMKAIALGSGFTAKVLNIRTTFSKEGAAANFAIGNVAAEGITKGTFTANGQIEVFFNDFGAYDAYVNEDSLLVYYRVEDNDGNCYVVTMPTVVLGSVDKQTQGPNQAMTATFQFGADPDPVTGSTMQLDRFPAA